MNKIAFGLSLTLTTFCCFGFNVERGQAQQVIPDTGVGDLGTTVTGGPNYTINGGTTAGTNLFHSFSEFSIPTLGSATFTTNPSIQNIFSRVTGGNVSSIDGTITATANLFLLNPNGILFGPNARLNIGGSFLASTANSIQFPDGSFSATNPTAPPLLSINAPIGLNFNSTPAPIQVNGNGHGFTNPPTNPIFGETIPSGTPTGLATGIATLPVPPGQTLGLVGGDLTLTGGTVTANDGRVELGAVGNGVAQQVGITLGATGFQLDYSSVNRFGKLRLNQQAAAYATSLASPSSMQIVGQQIAIEEGAIALVQGFGPVPGGNLQVTASEQVIVSGTTPTLFRSQIRTEAFGTGAGTNVTITTPRLNLQDGARVEATSFVAGNSGNVQIQASEAVEITGFVPALPQIFSILTSATFGSGNAGDITVNTRRLSLRDSGSISAATIFGTGDGGNVTVNATDRVEVIGGSPVLASTLDASSISSGDAQSVTVNTRQVVVRDGGSIGTQALATGSGGNVRVNASESIEVTGSSSATGSPSQIAASSTINFTAPLFGFPPIPAGDSGSLEVNTNQVTLNDGGLITVQNQGTGNSGDLRLAAETLTLNSGSGVTASSASGEGGNINLQIGKAIVMRRGSLISAEAGGTGNGGNITINAPFIVAVPGENSDIIANAFRGNGGNITITTQGILGLEFRDQLTEFSDITASSQFGISGTVTISNPSVNPTGLDAELQGEVLDPNQQVDNSCAAVGSSTFTVMGRGGLPDNPTAPRPGQSVWSDLRDLSAFRQVDTVQLPPLNTGSRYTEATGMRMDANGEIVLVAEPAGLNAGAFLASDCGDSFSR